MTEDEFWNVYFLFLMDGDGDSFAIVLHRDEPLLLIDNDLESVHLFVPVVVVCGVDEDFIEYFVQSRDIFDLPVLELLA